MKRLSYMINRETNPYHNIALEEYLLDHVAEDEVILYLWQNRKTVVIGYNQNAWRECRVEALSEDGGFVARRLSGGGAVFHDLGNLNFTFLVRRADYDVEKQSEVILRAVQSFGIPAIRNGRNDLTVEGRKFSGNAFYRRGDCCYHHGTILIRADKGLMGNYLTVSKEKLKSKGVESVKSRVVNLEEYVPELTVSQMEEALVRAFGDVYGGAAEAGIASGAEHVAPEPYDMRRIDSGELEKRQERFGSWEWLYGRKIPFQYEVSRKFSWGEVQIQLEVSEGVIRRAVVWTDAMDVGFSPYAEKWLEGVRYRKEELMRKLEQSSEAEQPWAEQLEAEQPEAKPSEAEQLEAEQPEAKTSEAEQPEAGKANRLEEGRLSMLADVIECLMADSIQDS